MGTRCPRCSHEAPAGEADCPRCGVVFARHRPAILTGPALAPRSRRRPAPPPAPDRAGVRALVAGGAVSAVALAVPFSRFVFSYLGTLVHELGHAVADWSFGRPAIPAFDFLHGGGVTVAEARQPLLAAAIAIAIGATIVRFRRVPAARNVLAAAGAAWTVLVLSGADVAVTLAAGHAAELAFAALCLSRALEGRALRTPAERPAYAFAGWFVWARQVGFAWNLATRHEARVEYELAKGGGAWMDLSRIADEFLGVSLATLAAAYLVVALLVPVAVLAVARRRARREPGAYDPPAPVVGSAAETGVSGATRA